MSNIDRRLLDTVVQLAGDIYKDLAQPTLRRLGIALVDLVDWGLIPTLKLRLRSVKARAKMEHSLSQFREGLERLDENDVQPIQPQLGLRLIDDLGTQADDDLRDLFTRLLTAAASKSKSKFVHPSFIHAIENMSSDEAKIITYLSANSDIPFIILRLQFDDDNWLDKTPPLTRLDDQLELMHPEAIPIYLSNLVGLGFIELGSTALSNKTKYYDPLNAKYKSLAASLYEAGHGDKKFPITIKPGYYRRTPYCMLFIQACGLDQTGLPP